MIAILSATEHDYYAMPLPFVVESWNRIGVRCIVFIPSGDNPKLELAKDYCSSGTRFFEFECEEKRIPTYSQVIRLFGAAIPNIPETEILITGDSDMCVFGDYFNFIPDKNKVHVIGADLTPADQYPICYCMMPAITWKTVFGINKSYQAHVSELIDPIEGLNIRGEQWCYDQWFLKKKLDEYGGDIVFHPRSNGQNQFATRRADRDGWHFDPYNIIDAHLPRPLTDESNFQKVLSLLNIKFPERTFNWATEFRNEYLKLI